MTALELPVSDWEDKWIDVYLDISSKLLDICNAFSSELSRLNQGNLPLKCALHNLDSASSKQYLRALVDASVKILYPTIQAGVDTVEIDWLVKTIEELRAGAEKLSQGIDLLAKGVYGFFQAVITSRDTLLSSVRFDKTVNDRSPGRNRDMQVVH
ncbi:hypothetical protein JHK87_031714 [Glycine soja]|nr:hypothetical protein JHK87_031714 [Glycine soja]